MSFCFSLLGRQKAAKESVALVEQQLCKQKQNFDDSLQEELNQATGKVCKT